ncbi:conserved hypothetical protein [Xanthomonas oryzae pv. oryzae MAFF 311018]|nr:conserved hypothetical protein [Xanthomonas oryzae pv. oryzae MAFF 311018]
MKSLAGRARGALAARGTRRKPVPGGSMAASMPPTVPQSARTPHQTVGGWFVEKPGTPRRWLSTALKRCIPTNATGPCLFTVAGLLAAWVPPRSLQDVLAACPAMVGGQGACSQTADHP